MTPREQAPVWQPDTSYAWLVSGLLWVLIVLMIVPDNFNYQNLATMSAPESGSLASRLLWLGLLGAGLLLTLRRPGLAWLLLRELNPFVLLFLVLAVASIFWSIDAPLSLRRLLRLFTIILVCFAFGLCSWHAHRFQRTVRPILTVLLAGSIAFGVLEPTLAIHQEISLELAGAWRGLTNHKNGLGALAGFGLIFWVHAGLSNEVGLLRGSAGVLLSLCCLALSRSTTALLASGGVIALLIVLMRCPQALRPQLPHWVVVLAIALALYAGAVLHVLPGLDTLIAPLTELSGKNTTLTGRTTIWSILGEHISHHPLFGTGYGAYWTPSPVVGAESYQFVAENRFFYPGSAHNGYLEIVNDLGAAGLVCLLAYLVTYLRQALRLLRIDPSQSALYLALFFEQVITNMSETHWFSVLSVDFVILTLATTALGRGLLEFKFERVFGQPQHTALPVASGTPRHVAEPEAPFAPTAR